MDLLLDPSTWIAFATLTALEIVLGIDNIVFLTLLVGRLPAARRDAARRAGLVLAMGTRIALLLSIGWVMGLTLPLFALAGQAFSGRDLILLAGGAFLLWKASHEIYAAVEHGDEAPTPAAAAAQAAAGFAAIVAQIAVVDIVFSLDSVITAVGMVDRVGVMIAAVVASVALMMVGARPIGEFVERHPSMKVLALSFLVMVGTTLVAEGFGVHVPKAVVYAAMGFSLAVEFLNIRARARRATRGGGGGRPVETA